MKVSGQKPRVNLSFALALSLCLVQSYAPTMAKSAKDSEQKSPEHTSRDHKSRDHKSRDHKVSEGNKREHKGRSGRLSTRVGNQALDGETLTLINSGDWKAVEARLTKQLAESKKGQHRQLLDSYRQAWLAFALMYQSQYDVLTRTVASMDKECFDSALAKSDDEKRMLGNALVIKAFDQVGQNKLDDAENTLKLAPEICSGDSLYNFALAAVAGKKGDAAKAVLYARRSTDIDPRFAWGYRTIGFLAQKRLKDNALAEDALTKALLAEPRLDEARDMLVEIKLARNDFDGATDVAAEGIRIEPRRAVSHFRLAQILTQQWRLREALKELDLAISEDTRVAKYYRNRAAIKRFQKDLSGAIADQMVAVDLSKDKGFELTELASLNLAAGNKNKAIDNYKEALAADAENQVAREKLFKLLIEEKRYPDLIAAYQEQLAKRPNSADLHMGYAAVLLASGDREKAIEEFVASANLNQTDPAPHRALAAYYMQQKQYALAAKSYTRALNILPTSVKDLVALGFCYAENDDYMQAEAAFVTAMALQKLSPTAMPDDPSPLDVMRSLAYLLYDEGRFGDATSQFESILAIYQGKGASNEDRFFMARCKLMRDLNASSAKALLAAFGDLPEERQKVLRYGMIESFLDAGQPTLARQALDVVPAAERSSLAYCLYDAAIGRLSGDNKKALEAISPAVPLAEAARGDDKPMAARVLCEKARILFNQGDLDGALASARAGLSQYDKCYPASLLLAEILLKKGDNQGALDASHRALEINPYYAQAYVTTGEAQQAVGKNHDAMESFKKAIELYPCCLDAHRALLGNYRKQALAREAQKEEAEIAQLESRTKAASAN
ncbi:MAG: tetratricopeptide repeat protein [Cyanobacteria bacterium REEB67]|nr:tetratricopeptide repeat protein [Cyanobacteria bacterium REEB67]